VELHPTWSEDGTRIIFSSDWDGSFELYVMDADGSNQTRLTADPASDNAPSWRR
jgi:TolB protein